MKSRPLAGHRATQTANKGHTNPPQRHKRTNLPHHTPPDQNNKKRPYIAQQSNYTHNYLKSKKKK
ncbi:hypothetical protein, partial [Escherichia coli]|uniref:hypothetical protein n=1 Tax=Escherichia coli TaxID=562 RepID=UPI002024DA8D